MDPFPLLTLPQDTLQKLLNKFQVEELFQLSQCSRKALNVMKTFSSSFDRTPCLSVTTGAKHEVTVRLRSGFFNSLSFNFYGERDPKCCCYLRFPNTYNFDGQSIDFCKEGTGRPVRLSSFGCATPHSTADFLKFAHYIKTLFNADLNKLEITVNSDTLKATLMSELLKKSQSLLILGGGVTHEEMVQVLECFDGVKHLNLCCSPGKYFSYDKTISAYALSVGSATWIRRHNLMKLDCEYVRISGSHLENEDLNAFLKHWLQSGDKKLKTMRIYATFGLSEEKKKNAPKFVQEEVLKGLPTLPGAPKRQDFTGPMLYRHGGTPFETGMDLRRESDGVLATVVVRDERLFGVSFIFVVWQEPNPNVGVVLP